MDQGNEQSTTAQDSALLNLDIAPDGDIILLVGEEPNQRTLRVHSFALKIASKVFAAMFGPHFTEGQSLSSADPRIVPLPEDDSDAMATICCVIHYRRDLITDVPDIDKICNIALSADKYEFTVALQPFFQIWMRNIGEVKQIKALLKATVAAYIFDDAAIFADVTKFLIMHCSEKYTHHWDGIVNDFLPPKVLGNRATLIQPLVAVLLTKPQSCLLINGTICKRRLNVSFGVG